jgi:hypothetical protein
MSEPVSLTGHLIIVRDFIDGTGYQAVCSCLWSGPGRELRSSAMVDAVGHHEEVREA